MSKINSAVIGVFVGMLSNLTYSAEFKNPYVDKNISTHLKDFATYEYVSEFHNAINSYNQNRKSLPEIITVKDHYELKDQQNTVSFTVLLIMNGDFYYNGKLTNMKKLKAKSPKTTMFNFLISDAMADEVYVSDILTAALLTVESSFFSILSSEKDRLKVVQERLKFYQNACESMPKEDAPQYLDKKNKSKVMINNLLKEISNNANKEWKVVKDSLGDLDPNCSNGKKKFHALGAYSRVVTDSDAKEIEDQSKTNPAVCIALKNLQECIGNLYYQNVNETPRSYLKQKQDTDSDDLKQYSSGREK